jgi:hypothetical protein
MSCKQISNETNILPAVIRRLANENKVRYIRIGRSLYLIGVDSIIKYFRWHFFPRKNITEKQEKIKEFIKKYDEKIK